MEINLVTKEYLAIFKEEVVTAIELAVNKAAESGIAKKQWLRGRDVRKLLGISSGTLQTLRINGTSSFRKIGGSMFYNASDIDKMLKGGE